MNGKTEKSDKKEKPEPQLKPQETAVKEELVGRSDSAANKEFFFFNAVLQLRKSKRSKRTKQVLSGVIAISPDDDGVIMDPSDSFKALTAQLTKDYKLKPKHIHISKFNSV